LPRFDDVVAEVTVACQPDAPVDHAELAAQAPEVDRLAGAHVAHAAVHRVGP
jgi:hypothetical protein